MAEPTTTAYSIHPTYPPSSLIAFNPFKNPPPLSPPITDRSLAHPFNISPQVYHNALNFVVPVTIALIYATTVTYFNKVNARRKHKPWSFSNTTSFFVLVVAHNVFLALYSCWTFIGMVRAFRASWPGFRNDYRTAGVVDSLCKLHGPRGLGSAATYSASSGSWSISDVSMKLAGGLPDTTDVGRIWNEGLSYYGWIFYLSKFYEVVDTAIVLTKGKKSSMLQTYHHTGAMFAMWAGIRFMSPPIWMFTCINAFIHTLMYSYYTVAAFGTRVHPLVKRTLTSAQIFQIVFGASYAFAHLWVAYDVPSYLPSLIQDNLSTALPGAYDAVASSLPSGEEGDLRSILKKAALRAAGQEGLAANVRDAKGETFGIDAIHAAQARRAQQEIKYHLQTTKTHCLDTSGEVFAILLNMLYLIPLAYLFITFFISYFEKHPEGQKKDQLQQARDAADKAGKDLASEIAEAMENRQGGTTQPPPGMKDRLEKATEDAKFKSQDFRRNAQGKVEDISNKVKQDLEKVKSKTQKDAGNVNAKASEAAENTNESAKGTKDAAKLEGEGSAVKEEDDDADGVVTNGNGKAETGDKDGENEDSADSGAYEANPDEMLGSEEKKAEKKMQNGA